jgi:hypothetical protein
LERGFAIEFCSGSGLWLWFAWVVRGGWAVTSWLCRRMMPRMRLMTRVFALPCVLNAIYRLPDNIDKTVSLLTLFSQLCFYCGKVVTCSAWAMYTLG